MSEAVVKAVSTVEGCPSTSLPPLYNAVNPEALERVFTVTKRDAPDRSGRITFQYSESVVTIDKNGYLEVQESLKILDDKKTYR
nr:HalOD1 output domain-containing protein [Haloarcula taiwanensis]